MMLDLIVMFLKQTPVWVYILFAYLMFKGYSLSKDHWVPLKVVWIIPAVFFGLSIESMVTHFGVSVDALCAWGFGIIAGVILGYGLVARKSFEVDLKQGAIMIAGSWMPMLQILAVFACKYYFGYMEEAYPEINKSVSFMHEALGLSGFVSGLFVGQLVRYVAVISAHKRQS